MNKWISCLGLVVLAEGADAQTVPIAFKRSHFDCARGALSAFAADTTGLPDDFENECDSLCDEPGHRPRTKRVGYALFAKKLRQSTEKKEVALKREFAAKRGAMLDRIAAESDPERIFKLERRLARIEREEREAKVQLRELHSLSKTYAYLAKNERPIVVFPVKNAVGAQIFYQSEQRDNKAQFLKNSTLAFNTAGGHASIFNEIYSDIFGPLRLGFGALLSNNTTDFDIDTFGILAVDSFEFQQNATQRLLGGGGNAVLSVSFPLVSARCGEGFNSKIYLNPKASFDVPQLGERSGRGAWNLDLGIEGSSYYVGANELLTLYANFRVGYVDGNGAFHENLLKPDRRGFLLAQGTLGIAINSTFRLGFSAYTGRRFVRESFRPCVSFSVIPGA